MRYWLFFWMVLIAFVSAAKDLPVTLSELYRFALEHRPEFSAIEEEKQKLLRLVRPASVLPNPVVGVSGMGSGVLFKTIGKDMMSGVGVSAMQAFPGSRKRSLSGKRFFLIGREKEALLEQRKARVKEQIAGLYFTLLFVREAQKIVDETDKILKTLEEIATARYETGRGKQADIIKVQLSRARLLREREEWRKKEEVAQAKLNGLIGRAQGAKFKPLPALSWKKLSMDEKKLYACAFEKNPELQELYAKLETEKNDVELERAKKAWDMMIGSMFRYRGAIRPLWSLSLSWSVPLYSRAKEEEKAKAEEKDIARLRNLLEQKKQDIAADLSRALSIIRKNEIQRKLYLDLLLKEAKWNIEANLAQYTTGKGSMLDVLDAVRAYLSLMLEEKGLTKEMLQELAVIEYHCPKNWLKEVGYE